ncbi:MAG: DNA polymerase III subunit delta [Armatimonadota bacterium]|nr:DNA polymerase III subunit delta [Armatimonadota bacterium]
MQLLYAQIAQEKVLVPKGPVYLLFGREQGLVEEGLAKLLAGVRQSSGAEPEVHTLYGSAATCEQVALELANLSLLSAGKVVVVRDAARMKAAEQVKLAALLPALGTGSLLVLIAGEPSYDTRTKRRRLFNEKLEAAVNAVGVSIEFPEFQEKDAERWVQAEAEAAGLHLGPGAAAQMVLLAGTDRLRLRNELAKLVAYAGTSRKVTAADVEGVVSRSPEATAFELVDAIGNRRPDQALMALKVLLDGGEAEQRILALIARQIRLVWQAKYLLEKGYLRRGNLVPQDVAERTLPRDGSASVLGSLQRSYLRDKILRQATAFSWPALRRGLQRVLAADLALKGIEGSMEDPRLVLEVLVLELASGGARQRLGRR